VTRLYSKSTAQEKRLQGNLDFPSGIMQNLPNLQDWSKQIQGGIERMLETKHLILRPYTLQDFDALLLILSDPTTMHFWPRPYTGPEVKTWIERSMQSYVEHEFGRYAVVHKATQKLIGDCGILKGNIAGEVLNDLGYIIHHPYWEKGYATEAVQAVKNYAFQTLHLDVLYANMAYNHHASQKVAEKIGMKRLKEFTNERNRNIKTFLYVVYRNG
jgi:RimJ/RimL family protein N-acetyltransferase